MKARIVYEEHTDANQAEEMIPASSSFNKDPYEINNLSYKDAANFNFDSNSRQFEDKSFHNNYDHDGYNQNSNFNFGRGTGSGHGFQKDNYAYDMQDGYRYHDK
jgi:hypothetical protein